MKKVVGVITAKPDFGFSLTSEAAMKWGATKVISFKKAEHAIDALKCGELDFIWALSTSLYLPALIDNVGICADFFCQKIPPLVIAGYAKELPDPPGMLFYDSRLISYIGKLPNSLLYNMERKCMYDVTRTSGAVYFIDGLSAAHNGMEIYNIIVPGAFEQFLVFGDQ